MIYLDTSYIVKCYLQEPESAEVLDWLEGKSNLHCCLYGRFEFFCAVKRHVRQNRLSRSGAQRALSLMGSDERQGIWIWIPITPELLYESCSRLQRLADKVFIRSGDALHLTCAAEGGFERIYSHDRHLLAAAPYFGLEGCDILEK